MEVEFGLIIKGISIISSLRKHPRCRALTFKSIMGVGFHDGSTTLVDYDELPYHIYLDESERVTLSYIP